jgi:co-chaperonin GroES (HSP10)
MMKDEYIKQHFPEVDPGATPAGAKILVQLRTVKEKTSGGIVLVESTQEFNNGNTQIGRIVATGGIAFRDRSTGDEWKEGAWAKIGDLVILPRWGGFRFEIPVPGTESKAIFAVFDDTNVQMVVNSNFEAFDQLL